MHTFARLMVVSLCSLGLSAGQAADLTVNSRIAVDTANAAEVKAAEDLSSYLERITGRQLPVEDHAVAAEGRYTIAVGNNHYTDVLSDRLQEVDPDGFIIQSEPDRLLIRGSSATTTAFGVNFFLQKYCGVRWYLPLPDDLGTVVPQRSGIELEPFTDVQEPSFVIREFWAGEGGDEFRARNLVGSRRWFVQHEVGPNVLPIQTYHAEHPEYFALVNGRRDVVPAWFHPCTSNPGVLQVFTDYAVQYFNRSPHASVVPMGLNDGTGYCECDGCLAEGDTPSDRFYTFYDRVARAVQEKHLGKKVGVLVYAGIKDLPSPQVLERIELGNLTGALPWDRTDWFVPERRAAHQQIIRSWSERLDRIFLWDWFTLRTSVVPTMNIRAVDDLLKFAKSLGNCDGWFCETNQVHPLHGPYIWVYAQLLWNVDQDVDELLDDFCTGMFGKGAPWMREYYDRTQQVWWRQTDSEVALWGNHAAELNLFTENDVAQMRACLEQARQATETEAERARVELVAEVFGAFHAVWEGSLGMRQAVDLTTVSDDDDARRAEAIIAEMLEGQQRIDQYRERIEEKDSSVYVRQYAGFRWQMDVPWVVSGLIDYRLASDQQPQLQQFFRQMGEQYGDYATGRMGRDLAALPDLRAAMEGANLLINPSLQQEGFEPNGLRMHDWASDELCPAGWYRRAPENTLHFYHVTDADALGGIAYGIRSSSASACYAQIVPAEPGSQYLVRARIKPSLHSGASKAELIVAFWKDLQVWTTGNTQFMLPSGIENDRWYHITGLVTAPEDATHINVQLWGNNFGDMGQDSVLFDDIQLTRVD